MEILPLLASTPHSTLIYNIMKATAEKRYALLQAARDSDYVKKVHGSYFNVFFAAFGEEGEKWDLFMVLDGEFPDMNDLHKYDGFVISGSPCDAYGNDLWILKLCFLLQTLDAMEIKVLGICFGHQVLCRALGGKVGRSCTGWDIGIRKIRIVKDLPPCSFLSNLSEIPASLSIIECHQDEVLEVPLGAEVIAFSDKTGVEMFNIGDHILGIQGHPEYTRDILYNLVDRLLNNNSIEVGYAEIVKFGLEKAEPDRKCLERICRNFLSGDTGRIENRCNLVVT
ncbi:hypothetical protein GH714_006962 [Hevea brasiliensis]|uniref:Glutamine amidotransferase domain-containing protein n=1 Tax=Hevea brasiliensis TaxID=3981 RepID=A0A6A6MB93_HEVBR|nr:hypothetical protein GH714_006962 [Hevea brasiliensis]